MINSGKLADSSPLDDRKWIHGASTNRRVCFRVQTGLQPCLPNFYSTDFMDFVLEERLHLYINEEAIEDDPADVRFVTG